ncbi:hypothetical protein F4553_008063 [Allocatelliglobosispora scoriae]|uniref:Uncharacterized protein n=1 Tax=Allocatelliglobosispora scoriae TaxID=643052 RepID=A0A841C5Q8_9ACTN|nr:hypothetical protein [Allocatelliglobosispora scoriae]MBB5874629.1 hypothetical protein [Allocatelliglobosispora scoriae]
MVHCPVEVVEGLLACRQVIVEEQRKDMRGGGGRTVGVVHGRPVDAVQVSEGWRLRRGHRRISHDGTTHPLRHTPPAQRCRFIRCGGITGTACAVVGVDLRDISYLYPFTVGAPVEAYYPAAACDVAVAITTPIEARSERCFRKIVG